MSYPTETKPLTAKEVWKRADETLRKIDRSFLITHHESRHFPQFTISDVTLGSMLGKGGFSVVSEVVKIQLSEGVHGIASLPAPPEDDIENDEEHDPALIPVKYPQPTQLENDPDDHIDPSIARSFMCKYCLRRGSARYAIKRLKGDLSDIDRARGAVDLAIEIKLLSTLWHPNIIKMRGYSQTERVSVETFLLIDRLFGTLDHKIESWEKSLSVLRGLHGAMTLCCGGSGSRTADKSTPVMELLQERLLVAYDLSSALLYLHERRLVYRDIKPENMGFDVRGDIKLFDFGLCTSLEPEDKCKDGSYGYHLSFMTGSVPYMAPEIALKKPYDKEADVYSFSVLLWEVMGLEWAYNGFDARQYFVQVCARNLRLPIPKSWPATVKIIIQEGWDPNPQKRPTMKRICTLLHGELKDMTDDATVVNRTQHMLNKSRRSLRGLVDFGKRSVGGGKQMSIRSSATGVSNMVSSRGRRESFAAGGAYGVEEQKTNILSQDQTKG